MLKVYRHVRWITSLLTPREFTMYKQKVYCRVTPTSQQSTNNAYNGKANPQQHCTLTFSISRFIPAPMLSFLSSAHSSGTRLVTHSDHLLVLLLGTLHTSVAPSLPRRAFDRYTLVIRLVLLLRALGILSHLVTGERQLSARLRGILDWDVSLC